MVSKMMILLIKLLGNGCNGNIIGGDWPRGCLSISDSLVKISIIVTATIVMVAMNTVTKFLS